MWHRRATTSSPPHSHTRTRTHTHNKSHLFDKGVEEAAADVGHALGGKGLQKVAQSGGVHQRVTEAHEGDLRGDPDFFRAVAVGVLPEKTEVAVEHTSRWQIKIKAQRR